jgi:hypothetical protein
MVHPEVGPRHSVIILDSRQGFYEPAHSFRIAPSLRQDWNLRRVFKRILRLCNGDLERKHSANVPVNGVRSVLVKWRSRTMAGIVYTSWAPETSAPRDGKLRIASFRMTKRID